MRMCPWVLPFPDGLSCLPVALSSWQTVATAFKLVLALHVVDSVLLT